ncbi:cysteine hydrolase [Bradyrhizobium sp. 183]|uniref:cysteine hydrolase family protein n=1 Tax=unclassified Bradyrhizobium TaxID=2631580 RepID=UPI001FFEF8C4|nr:MULTISPECIES: isochorismatase family cysteine hydrolase [unclassified Bradyrhizobium]UPJ79296.1 cysteine hydrolase [Bradyrhizobium sp. 184]UPJ87089.1 cysteine hydrolase [Bradyrhizobium sp. 183]
MNRNRLERALGHPAAAGWISFDLSEPARTALLIVDMQNFGCRRDMGLGRRAQPQSEYWFSRQDQVVVPNIQKLLAYFRSSGMRVTYVCVGPLLPDASDMYERRVRRDKERLAETGSDHFWSVGSIEHQVIDELKPAPGEMIFNKNCTSAFNSTNIDQVLRNMGVQYLVITGMATNACVETTARDAADRGYDCVLVDDGCLAGDQASHDGTLRNFASLFGRVSKTDQVIEELQKARVSAAAPTS